MTGMKTINENDDDEMPEEREGETSFEDEDE